MAMATSSDTKRAGMHKTLALLCCLPKAATSGVQANAARTSACLLAVMATPLADPQIKMPSSAWPEATSSATA